MGYALPAKLGFARPSLLSDFGPSKRSINSAKFIAPLAFSHLSANQKPQHLLYQYRILPSPYKHTRTHGTVLNSCFIDHP
jgi:hypothetical protein